MLVGEDIFVMLLTQDKFKTFTPKPICDATKSTEVLVCLSSESRKKVDEMVRKAVAAGGTTYNEPQDHGFMYGHGFQDLDGHIWELFYSEAYVDHPPPLARCSPRPLSGSWPSRGCPDRSTILGFPHCPPSLY